MEKGKVKEDAGQTPAPSEEKEKENGKDETPSAEGDALEGMHSIHGSKEN